MSKHLSLVHAGQMAEIDRATILGGTACFELMLRAGTGVWSAAKARFAPALGSRVLFLCGKGNNGGDGFVAARLAQEDGHRATIALHADLADVVDDARRHLDDARDAGVTVTEVDTHSIAEAVGTSDLVFDALLGTGFRGSLRSPIRETVSILSETTRPIVAVDVPSGLNADTGIGDAAHAELTVTFGSPKPAHVFQPGRSACGRLHVVDIGLSESETQNRRSALVGFGAAEPNLPGRSRAAHKGEAGRVSVIAGSVGMTGAACLTSAAALRSGAGLVTLGLPESLNDIAEIKLTEVMTVPLPEVRRKRCLSLRARGEIESLTERANAIAVGPGLGRHHETVELVRRLIQDLTAPTVLDADALNAFAGRVDELKSAKQDLVLTPHWGEYQRLVGDRIQDPVEGSIDLAERTGATVVLKGAPTVVAPPGQLAHVNMSGNPGMATGGSGDVLTGLIAGLIAQGASTADAALSGVFWHGLAGDIAAERVGERGMLAGDILENLPEADALIGKNSRFRYIETSRFA